MQKDRRDAFSVLLKSAAKRSSDPPLSSAKKAKADAPAPSKYAACPVCSCQIPTAFLAEHAASCGVGKRESASTPAAQGTKHAGAADTPGEPSVEATRAISGSAGQHTPEAVGNAPEAAAVPANEQLPGSEQLQAPPLQPQATPGASAFDHMLQRQKDLSRVLTTCLCCLIYRHLPSLFNDALHSDFRRCVLCAQTHCFYLEDLHNGGFRCHWWLKGSTGTGRPAAKAVWSATSSIALSKLPGAGDGKLGLQLLTNVAPAAGGGDAVTWQAPGLLSNHSGPPGSQYRGSPALLKSALQKNVRLCRPPSAIRRGTHHALLCKLYKIQCTHSV